MIIDNKIDRAFGKTTVFAGIVFFLIGSLIVIAGGVILGSVALILAAFVIFTFSGVEFDTKYRKVRQYNKLFGIFKTGKWKPYDIYIGITLIPISTFEVMASWSNRISSTKTTDYRIFFVNKSKKPAFAIKKCKTEAKAKSSLDEFSLWLKLPVYSVKKEGRKSWNHTLN